jgi:hypothetical protein
VLSDDEERALEDLERCYVLEAPEPVLSGRGRRASARRSSRPPGSRTVLVLACISLALLLAGTPVAAMALALATVIAWSFWRLVVHGPPRQRTAGTETSQRRWAPWE